MDENCVANPLTAMDKLDAPVLVPVIFPEKLPATDAFIRMEITVEATEPPV